MWIPLIVLINIHSPRSRDDFVPDDYVHCFAIGKCLYSAGPTPTITVVEVTYYELETQGSLSPR